MVNLGLASSFNAFVLGNFSSSGSDTEGAVAVQGNATLSSYSVNAKNQAGHAGNALAVGGNLNFTSGSINHGNAWVGGSSSLANLGFGGSLAHGVAPLSFASAGQQLTTLSASLDAAATNGSVSFNPWGGVTFSGDGSAGTQVFDVLGSSLLHVNNIMFSGLASGQTLIVNVSGAQAGFQNVGLSGFAGYNVLFNFVDATELVLSGVGVYGSILAPNATVSGGNGQINGNVVVKNWFSNIQINDNHLFVPANVALPALQSPASAKPVPEPGTLALAVPALTLVALCRRRSLRRSTSQAGAGPQAPGSGCGTA